MRKGSVNPLTGRVEVVFGNPIERQAGARACVTLEKDLVTAGIGNGEFQTDFSYDPEIEPFDLIKDGFIRLAAVIESERDKRYIEGLIDQLNDAAEQTILAS